VYNHQLHQRVKSILNQYKLDIAGTDNAFYIRLMTSADTIQDLYQEIYGNHPAAAPVFEQLFLNIIKAYSKRPAAFKNKDEAKAATDNWFLSNQITGMSLYVDRFCGTLTNLGNKLAYFENLGVNFLHLMPLFESPPAASDGGYAVSDFRKIDERFGSLADLKRLRRKMDTKQMYLMTDIVLNHTSNQHEWALKAKNGDPKYQDYFYMYDDRAIPDQYDQSMPEIFPESSPGNFTYVPECNKWVMTVFHHYQWDLNYANPAVFLEMLDIVLFYANLGVDILRIDAPAFIWKQLGTNCQNLPQAHALLRLIKQCVLVASPGMALLGEAIVAPAEIMKYFGSGRFAAKECDFAYNATQMALQWDMLATGDTRVMLAAQNQLQQKPYGASWITYTRCHDDIGLGYDDEMIRRAGYDPYRHRRFLQDYYTGNFVSSSSAGALFSANPQTGDARISGSLASLCGLEKAIPRNDTGAINTAIQKILLMQAHSFFLGGIPMIFYGDEAGYTNDYSYLTDETKSYDNRWMHRPVIDWHKNELINTPGTVENIIFSGTQKLISIRKKLPAVADHNNLNWFKPYNIHVAGYARTYENKTFYGVFNFSNEVCYLAWAAFGLNEGITTQLTDHWIGIEYDIANSDGYLIIEPFGFHLMEVL
jgi:amylosucrase